VSTPGVVARYFVETALRAISARGHTAEATMPVIRFIVSGFALAALAACAAHPEPIIDMQGVDQQVFERDWDECAGYADQVSPAKGAAKGAAVGAVVGAASGAITGGADESAGFGSIYGATRSGLGASREQQQVFKRCMSGRGYRVLN
jgi:outer membrane lipoprotein SlyB